MMSAAVGRMYRSKDSILSGNTNSYESRHCFAKLDASACSDTVAKEQSYDCFSNAIRVPCIAIAVSLMARLQD